MSLISCQRRYGALFVAAMFAVLLLTAPLRAMAADAAITDEAQRIYQTYGDAVYQVQVIDLASGKKNAIGSGFQFTADGFMATNYHVVSDAIQKPGANKLEYQHEKGDKGSLKILVADVVHDLAILQMDKPGKSFVELGTSGLPKGSKLFSLGNPRDIGFTIIEGIHNGKSSESFIDKIHFSGAINPGMSGGPVLGHDGKVAGINVMTAGNQIGFLVPVEPLRDLMIDYMRQPQGYDFVSKADEYIQDQLLKSQQDNMQKLLSLKEWDTMAFGPAVVPAHIHDAFKCWGSPAHEEKDPYTYFWSACYSQDRVFLEENFNTGSYVMRYDLVTGKKDLALPRFYKFYEQSYGQGSDQNDAGEEDVTNFECNTKFVDIDTLRWKTSFCIRQYKRYPKLYDAGLYMALVGQGRKGLLVNMGVQGVSKENALAFATKFMSVIKKAPPDSKKAGDSDPLKQKDKDKDKKVTPASAGAEKAVTP